MSLPSDFIGREPIGSSANNKFSNIFPLPFSRPKRPYLALKAKVRFFSFGPCLLFTSFSFFSLFSPIRTQVLFPSSKKDSPTGASCYFGPKKPSKCASPGFQASYDGGPFLQPRTPWCVNQSKKVFASFPFLSFFFSHFFVFTVSRRPFFWPFLLQYPWEMMRWDRAKIQHQLWNESSQLGPWDHPGESWPSLDVAKSVFCHANQWLIKDEITA